MPLKQKRSCILVIGILLVFVVTETPRLYLHVNIFGVYQSSDWEHHKVWKTLTDQMIARVEQQFGDSNLPEHMSNLAAAVEAIKSINMEKYNETSTKRLFEKWQLKLKRLWDEVKSLPQKVLLKKKQKVRGQIKGQLRPVADRIFPWLEQYLKRKGQQIWDKLRTKLSNRNAMKPYNKIRQLFLRELLEETEIISRAILAKLPRLLLATTPYSENMNYILAIAPNETNIMGFKTLLEILKLSTILGCLSNFMLYISLSKNLRIALLKTLSCYKSTNKEATKSGSAKVLNLRTSIRQAHTK